MARLSGFEPKAYRLGGGRSILLSYRRTTQGIIPKAYRICKAPFDMRTRVSKKLATRSFPPNTAGMFSRKRENSPPDRQSRSIRTRVRGAAAPLTTPRWVYRHSKASRVRRFFFVRFVLSGAKKPGRLCRRPGGYKVKLTSRKQRPQRRRCGRRPRCRTRRCRPGGWRRAHHR